MPRAWWLLAILGMVGGMAAQLGAEPLTGRGLSDDRRILLAQRPPAGLREMPPADQLEVPPPGQSATPAAGQPEAPPPGQAGEIGGEVFGRQGGIFHPYLGLTEIYSDNVFRTNSDKKSGFITTISPGFWIALPHSRKKIMTADTFSFEPGGIRLSRDISDQFRRYQLYFHYGADIELNSAAGAEDYTSHTLEGLGEYSLRGGLTFFLIDRYDISHDERGTGASTAVLSKYKNNLFNPGLTFDVTERLKLRAEYSNYHVNYDDLDYRDRVDNAYTAGLSFQYTPRLALFGEYQYMTISYDEPMSRLRDSREHRLYGGLKWAMTKKTTGMVKAGYGTKDFDSAAIGSSNAFILEAQLNYEFSPKSLMQLSAWRRTNETDIDVTQDRLAAIYVFTQGIDWNFTHAFTSRIAGNLLLSYDNRTYYDIHGTRFRRDNFFRLSPSLRYQFNNWLLGSAGYIYSRRDSDIDTYDYTDNTLFVRLLVEL